MGLVKLRRKSTMVGGNHHLLRQIFPGFEFCLNKRGGFFNTFLPLVDICSSNLLCIWLAVCTRHCLKWPRVIFALPCYLLKLHLSVWGGCYIILRAHWGQGSWNGLFHNTMAIVLLADDLGCDSSSHNSRDNYINYHLLTGNILDILQTCKCMGFFFLCCLSFSVIFLGIVTLSGGDVFMFYLPS